MYRTLENPLIHTRLDSQYIPFFNEIIDCPLDRVLGIIIRLVLVRNTYIKSDQIYCRVMANWVLGVAVMLVTRTSVL